jgi:hypothetical protein
MLVWPYGGAKITVIVGEVAACCKNILGGDITQFHALRDDQNRTQIGVLHII